MRYFLAEDDDGHHYVVPLDKEDEWYEFLHNVYVLGEDGTPLPEGVIEIGGSPTQVTFENPEL